MSFVGGTGTSGPPTFFYAGFDILTIFANIKPSSVGAFCLLFFMSRSIKKGIYLDERLLKKIAGKNPLNTPMIKTWTRAAVISPEMLGFTFGVYNGKVHVEVLVTEDMVGHRLGEFSPTKKFTKHGGKMQKELEQKKQEAEINAAKGAKEASAGAADSKGAKK